MSYLFRQKLDLRELVATDRVVGRVMLAEPARNLGRLYAAYLQAHRFEVQHCQDAEDLGTVMAEFKPDILVFSLEFPRPTGARVLRTIAALHPSLPVITLAFNASAEDIKRHMHQNVASHINRIHTRPEDIVHIVKAILQK